MHALPLLQKKKKREGQKERKIKKMSLACSCPMKTVHRGWSFSHFKPSTDTSKRRQLSSVGNICLPIKSQEKSLKIICLVFNWLLMLLPVSSTLWATVFAKRLIILTSVYFFSRDTEIKHVLIKSPLGNELFCLANKWATWTLAFVAGSFV